jgi:molybdenum cofactor biosynthesis enzyme MoaA
MTPEEEKFQHRINELLQLAEKSKMNTQTLAQKLNSEIQTVLEKNIKRDELNTLIELTAEYGIKLQDVVKDSLDAKVTREITRLTEEIDQMFKSYDEWQTSV